jgi:sulfide dehydrogenase cytochrome subunit
VWIPVNKAVPLAAVLALLLATPLAARPDTESVARDCSACHGLTGASRGDLIPSIAGQKEAYLRRTLVEFKHGLRRSSIMGRLVAGYADRDLEAVAAYFSKFAWTTAAQKTDPAVVARGRALAEQRCFSCHDTAEGRANAGVPLIAGQWLEYLKLELEKLLDPNTPSWDPAMRNAVAGLGSADIDALAQFYASRQP